MKALILIFLFFTCSLSSVSSNRYINAATLTCSTTQKEDSDQCYNYDNYLNEKKYTHCKEYQVCSDGNIDYDYVYCEDQVLFYGDQCTDRHDCWTEYCNEETGKCDYRPKSEEHMSCERKSGCGKTGYCWNYYCYEYVTEEFGSCDEEENQCSPQFICIDGQCLKKGSVGEGGNVTSKYQCESFLTDKETDLCTNTYGDKIDDQLMKALAEKYKTINWDDPNIVLCDYAGDNMGSVEFLNLYYEENEKYLAEQYGEEKAKCTIPVQKEIDLLTRSHTLSLNDKDLKEYLNLKQPDPSTFECSEEVRKDLKCMETIERGREMDISIYHCDTKEGMICGKSSDSSEGGTLCNKIKRFYGEKCLKNEQCFTAFCNQGKCDYKEDGSECSRNKECGLKSYCSYQGKCEKYIEGGEDCSMNSCHPKYKCVQHYLNDTYTDICEEQGVLDDGSPAVEPELCKSFFTVDGLCSSDYSQDKEEGQISQMQAIAFKKIKWEEVKKLSDYSTINYGDTDFIDFYIKYMFLSERFDITTEDLECSLQPLRENILLAGYFYDEDDNKISKFKKFVAGIKAKKSKNGQKNDYEEEPTLPDEVMKKFLNLPDHLNDELTCNTSPEADKTCVNILVDEEYGDIKAKYFYCDKSKNEYCYDIVGSQSAKCLELKKFYGEPCEKDEECFTASCKNKVCSYKDKDDACSFDKECGLKDYCRNGYCKEYKTEETNICTDEIKCSPEFQCVRGLCLKRGKEEEGAKVEDPFLCKSFKMNNNSQCTANYDLDTYEDRLSKAFSDFYPTIKWDTVKLSDYAGENLGSPKVLDEIINYSIQQSPGNYSKETIECTINVQKETTLLGESLYTMTDKNLKEYLHIEKGGDDDDDDDNGGISKGAVAGIVIGVIVVVIIIAILVRSHLKKRTEKGDLTEKLSSNY